MNKLLWSGLLIVLMLSGCGGDGTPTRQNDFTPLTSIEIGAVSPTIAALTSTKLTAIGNFSGQFTRDIADQAVWSSDTPAVAAFVTPTSPSRVTGIAPGTAILTATMGGVSATFKLTVSSATISTVTITPAAPSISKGLPAQFAASGTFSDSTTQDLTFDAIWASSDPAVATVSNDPISKGFAKALAAGTTTISATLGGISGTTLMTVTEPVLQSITVTPANPSILSLLSSGNFQATGHFSDGIDRDITSQAVWSSSRPDIATIPTTGGAAKTFLQGTTAISATLTNASGTPISGTSNLKVTGGNLTSFTISPATVNLVSNTQVRMNAAGTFSNGATRDITGVVAWSVTDPALATVSAPVGNLVLLNALAVRGTTTVSATSGTLPSANKPILTVIAPVPTSLSIVVPPSSLPDLTAGTSARFTATAIFSDGTTQDVTANSTWTSSNAATATVGDIGINKGRVSGVANARGTTVISASYVGVGGVKAPDPTVTVTVTSRLLQTLTISPVTAIVGSGNQAKFTATAGYSDLSSKDVTEDATWTIDNTNIAILADGANQPGQVVGVASGTATLTATFGGKTQTATVTVTEP